MRRKLFVTILGLTLVALVSAQSMGPGHEQHHPPGTVQTTAMPGMGMMTQIESELDFLRHMIAHHQEAVASAEQLLEVVEREELRELAQGVIAVQTREIETMRRWLEQWYPEQDHEIAYQPMMRDLEGLAPDEVERAFVEDMIVHHMMAVHDARQLLMRGLAEHEEVAVLAREIITEQMREIQQLQSWLRDWYGVAAMGMMPDMMDPGAMDPMMPSMMGMHEMMRQCLAMMGGRMPGMKGQMGTMRGMPPMMGRSDDAGFVEALARAFLAGQGAEAEIVQVKNVYRVTYRDGDTEGVLLIDADTGEVTPETATE